MSRIIFASFFVLPFAIGNPVESEDELRAIERAHVAVAQIEANFQKALKNSKGDLGNCRIEKPKPGLIKVGRTSERLRNPKNAAPDWVKPFLADLSKKKGSAASKGMLVKLGDGHFGYLEPILTEPVCLKCHGVKLDKPVEVSLYEMYPEDKAVGYHVGDVRGVLWLEMKKE